MAFRILYSAASDLTTATITSSSDGSSNTDDNAVDNRVGKVWRTDSDTDEWIKWDLATAKDVDCVAIFNHNLTSSATVTIEGNSSDFWSPPTFSETLTLVSDSDSNVIARIGHFLASQQSYRWWRLKVTDPTNPDSYIQIGRIVFGAYYETTRDMSDDFRVEIIDPSAGERNPGEVPIVTEDDEKARFRRIRSSFEIVGQTEIDKWETIFGTIGNSKPAVVWWSPSDRPTKDMAYTYLVTPLSLAHQFISNYNIASLVWEEKTR